MKTCLLASVVACSMTSVATAEFTDTMVQVNATAQELTDNGFTQVGTGPFISYPGEECAENGCVTIAGTSGPLPLKGFLEFQFEDFNLSEEFYSGLLFVLDISYENSGLTRDILIDELNTETPINGVTAMTPEEANTAEGTCSFDSWMPAELLDSVIFNWTPDPPADHTRPLAGLPLRLEPRA